MNHYHGILRLGFVVGLVSGIVLGASRTEAREAAGVPGGHLLIVGGGLKPDDREVYQRFIELSGGSERGRVGVLRTASVSQVDANTFIDNLKQYGMPAGSVELLDISVENAVTSTIDAEMIGRIRACTGIFFGGGDQRRIGRALLRPDGTDTPALAAIRAVYEKGGVVGGTSAGAACMGESMFTSRGLAIDSLDYGVGETAQHRGAVVEQGLGFFKDGLIDQHFSHRGRLARLSRILLDRHITMGFGIDEDTAIDVRGDGSFEVLGRGGVTVIDSSAAEASDSPLGYSAHGLKLSYLERGDRYVQATRSFELHSSRKPIEASERSELDEIGLITDLSREGAVKKALTLGLVMSSLDQRAGLFIRSNGKVGHGYRFLFRKTAQTRGYHGVRDGDDCFSVLNVEYGIEPISATLKAPESFMPIDVATNEAREAIQGLVFRGIMPTEPDLSFHPEEAVTRGEFATILVRATNLGPFRARGVVISDIPARDNGASDAAIVVGAGLLDLDQDGAFHPGDPIRPDDMEEALSRARALASREDALAPPNPPSSSAAIAAVPGPPEEAPTDGDAGGTTSPNVASREAVALAVGRFLSLPWGEPQGR